MSVTQGGPVDKTLIKGIRVLETVARSTAPVSAGDVAADLGMTRSNAYRTLQTLVALKYLTKLPDRPAYEPTPRLFELGMRVGDRFGLKTHAPPILAAVVARTGETAAVAVLDGAEVMYLDRVDSPNPMRSVMRPGERVPAFCSASGRVLLAEAPEPVVAEAAAALTPITPATVASAEALRACLAEARRAGAAQVIGEWHPAVAAVAVPIRTSAGRLVAALSVSGPAARFGAAQVEACIAAARWGAEEFRNRI